MQATLVAVQETARNTKTFWLKPEALTFDYVAGQFVEIQLPHPEQDTRGQNRWFTLSSAPTEELLAITTKHDPRHSSSFKQTLFALQAGDLLTISEAMGDFVLPKDKTLPLLFVAGGLGITPMRSMIKWLADTREQREIRLLYGVENEVSIAFREVFESYNTNTDIILSSPPKKWTGPTGRLNLKTIQALSGWNESTLIYVSGPELMVESLERELKSAGIPPEKLVLDFFPGYPAN